MFCRIYFGAMRGPWDASVWQEEWLQFRHWRHFVFFLQHGIPPGGGARNNLSRRREENVELSSTKMCRYVVVVPCPYLVVKENIHWGFWLFSCKKNRHLIFRIYSKMFKVVHVKCTIWKLTYNVIIPSQLFPLSQTKTRTINDLSERLQWPESPEAASLLMSWGSLLAQKHSSTLWHTDKIKVLIAFPFKNMCSFRSKFSSCTRNILFALTK